jgi:hypothetical protein
MLKWNKDMLIGGRPAKSISVALYHGEERVRTVLEKVRNLGEVSFVPANYIDCERVEKAVGSSFNFRVFSNDPKGKGIEIMRAGW